MPPPNARDTAQRLIARERAGGGTPDDAVAVAERALRHLSDDLVGWFGPFGAHALVTRALVQARGEHPALAPVRVGGPSTPYFHGLGESGRVHGADAAVAGAVDMLASLVDLLGRMIGETLATALVEQSGRAGPAGRATHGSQGADGAADTGGAGGTTGANRDTTGSVTDD